MSQVNLKNIVNWLFPLACGFTAANIYYVQPLLTMIADDIKQPPHVVSTIITFIQIGNAFGLLFVVPLADIFPRKKILSLLYLCTAVAMVAMAFSKNIIAMDILALIIGCGSVAVPILIAYGAMIVDTNKMGAVIGNIMTGVLLGILCSRIVSSFLSSFGGWSTIYIFGSIVMVVILIAILSLFPKSEGGKSDISYKELLISTFLQLKKRRELRVACAIGFIVMALFTSFWANISYILIGNFSYTQNEIGLFSICGVAGALAAAMSGKLIDSFPAKKATIRFITILVLALSFICIGFGEIRIVYMVIGALFMDAAIQILHVSNQSVIYKLDKSAQSRIACCYMTTFSLGGAFGANFSTLIFVRYGWPYVCVFCIVLALLCIPLGHMMVTKEENYDK